MTLGDILFWALILGGIYVLLELAIRGIRRWRRRREVLVVGFYSPSGEFLGRSRSWRDETGFVHVLDDIPPTVDASTIIVPEGKSATMKLGDGETTFTFRGPQ